MTFAENAQRFTRGVKRCEVTLVEDASGFTVKSIDAGIVFIFATWSGDAVNALIAISHILSEINYSAKLYIVNNDGLHETNLRDLPILPHGKGEVLWIRDGTVVAVLKSWDQSSAAIVREYTKHLSS
jgi:hypothetical protein